MHRRLMLRAGMSVLAMGSVLVQQAHAGSLDSGDALPSAPARLRSKLVEALGTSTNAAMLKEAERLQKGQRTGVSAAHIDLHLRSAALEERDIALIAEVMRGLDDDEARFLSSFSLSYNGGVGDEGAVRMANSLPVSLPELGLVGCAIGNRGGEALLGWLEQTTRMRMICIEGNQFSNTIAKGFRAVARNRPGLTVFV
jgi:hypothetical protein